MSSCPLSFLVLNLAATRTFPPAIVKVCSSNIITSTDFHKLHLLVFYIHFLHITLFFFSTPELLQFQRCLHVCPVPDIITYLPLLPAPVHLMQSKFFYCVILTLLTFESKVLNQHEN